MVNRLTRSMLTTVLFWIGMAGCSTATVSPPAVSATSSEASTSVSPRRQLPPQPPLSAETCLIGRSCLELDPRPFAPCLVATSRCEHDAEIVRVQPDHTAS